VSFFALKKEMDRLSEFAWRYGMLLRKKVEEGSVITGHNRFVVLKISDAYSVVTRKLSEVTSLYHPSKKAAKHDLLTSGDELDAQKNALWLSAHLTQFNGLLKAYNGFFRNKHTRNLLKDLIRAKEGKDVRLDEVAAIAKHTISSKSRRQLRKALSSYVESRQTALTTYKSSSLRDLVASIEGKDRKSV